MSMRQIRKYLQFLLIKNVSKASVYLRELAVLKSSFLASDIISLQKNMKESLLTFFFSFSHFSRTK